MMKKKYLWIAVAAFLADRVSKLMWDRIPAEGMELIPGIIGLYPARNTGMAFSLFSGRPWFLGLVSLAMAAGIGWMIRDRMNRPLTAAGGMLALGGAAGNLLDRFCTGFVPDMIELKFVQFAVFNIADICVVIGCGLIMIDLIRGD